MWENWFDTATPGVRLFLLSGDIPLLFFSPLGWMCGWWNIVVCEAYILVFALQFLSMDHERIFNECPWGACKQFRLQVAFFGCSLAVSFINSTGIACWGWHSTYHIPTPGLFSITRLRISMMLFSTRGNFIWWTSILQCTPVTSMIPFSLK